MASQEPITTHQESETPISAAESITLIAPQQQEPLANPLPNTPPILTTPPQLKLSLSELVGQWHIIMTDFPMWLSGEKTRPTFNYGLEDDGLSDSVQYLNNKGQPDSITGHNTCLNPENTQFKWRGKGFLFLITSYWDLKYVSEDRQWAIVHFNSTLFTPAGHDVIHRQRDLDQGTKDIINAKLVEFEINPLTDITIERNENAV